MLNNLHKMFHKTHLSICLLILKGELSSDVLVKLKLIVSRDFLDLLKTEICTEYIYADMFILLMHNFLILCIH